LIEKNMMPDVLVMPELVVEVAADEITKSPTHTAGIALRFPWLIKIRDDKDVNSATNLEEVKQIKQG
jgi:DNA ligase-1